MGLTLARSLVHRCIPAVLPSLLRCCPYAWPLAPAGRCAQANHNQTARAALDSTIYQPAGLSAISSCIVLT
jgi:hypothetical protein